MDTYFVIHVQVEKDIYIIIINIIHSKQSYFCISQGSALTLFRRGGPVYNFLMFNFFLDSEHQKLLKQVYSSPSYSKYKGE